MRITVVIPALNEAGNIGRLVAETYEHVPASVLAEVIVVDDGSDDTTPDEVRALIADGRHPGLRLLRHKNRSGQSVALRTGITAATSPVIATMDGDGQNDPRDIPRLLEHLAAPGTRGPALVNGWRQTRKDTGSKRLASRAANKIRDWVLRDNCPDTGCGIKVYWREAFLRIPFSPACIATCRPCSRPTAMRSPTSRSTTACARPGSRSTPISPGRSSPFTISSA